MLEHGINVDSLGRHMAFMTYESHVLFALRFMIDCDLVGGNWVELKAGCYSVLDQEVPIPSYSTVAHCQMQVFNALHFCKGSLQCFLVWHAVVFEACQRCFTICTGPQEAQPLPARDACASQQYHQPPCRRYLRPCLAFPVALSQLPLILPCCS